MVVIETMLILVMRMTILVTLLRYFLKSGDNRIMRHWFWNRGLRCNCIGGWWKFPSEPVCVFHCFFGDKKRFESLIYLYFHPLIIRFFWLALMQFKLEEKIQPLLMCLEGNSFRSCSVSRADELPRGRVCLG